MLAIALKPRGIVCAAVCPGYVRTRLGGDAALLGVEESITGLRRVIAGLTLAGPAPSPGTTARRLPGRRGPQRGREPALGIRLATARRTLRMMRAMETTHRQPGPQARAAALWGGIVFSFAFTALIWYAGGTGFSRGP